MSPNILRDYFDEIEQLLLNGSNNYVEQFSATILNPERANLRLRVRFELRYLLAVSEALIIIDDQVSPIDYRYHFQDDQNSLIFRYDSTPHFPDLVSFPHHKHLPNEVIACEKPDLKQVLQEVMEFVA
jgi:Family of unknown function (DUF6516)